VQQAFPEFSCAKANSCSLFSRSSRFLRRITSRLASSSSDRLLQPFAVILRFQVQQAHFENVVDARAQLGHIKRFADKILSAGFKSAQLVSRLAVITRTGR